MGDVKIVAAIASVVLLTLTGIFLIVGSYNWFETKSRMAKIEFCAKQPDYEACIKQLGR